MKLYQWALLCVAYLCFISWASRKIMRKDN